MSTLSSGGVYNASQEIFILKTQNKTAKPDAWRFCFSAADQRCDQQPISILFRPFLHQYLHQTVN